MGQSFLLTLMLTPPTFGSKPAKLQRNMGPFVGGHRHNCGCSPDVFTLCVASMPPRTSMNKALSAQLYRRTRS